MCSEIVLRPHPAASRDARPALAAVLVLTLAAAPACGGEAPERVPADSKGSPLAPGGAELRYLVSGLSAALPGPPRVLGFEGTAGTRGATLAIAPLGSGAGQRWAILPAEDGSSFSLQNIEGGLCADVPGAAPDDGLHLQLFPCSGAPNQRFSRAASHLLLHNSGRCLAAGPRDPTAGASFVAVQRACAPAPDDAASDDWAIQAVGHRVHSLPDGLRVVAGDDVIHASLVLERTPAPSEGGGAPAPWDPSGRDLWLVQAGLPADPRALRFETTESGLCWDVPDASANPGVALQLYPCHGGLNQRFHLEGGHLTVKSSGLCLARSSGPSPGSPALLTQEPCDPAAEDQRFGMTARLVDVPTGPTP